MPDSQIASRMKTWDELNDKQKIEHLKGDVRNLARAVVDLDKVVAKLLNHKHLDGQMVASIGHPHNEGPGSVIHLSYELRNEGKRLL